MKYYNKRFSSCVFFLCLPMLMIQAQSSAELLAYQNQFPEAHQVRLQNEAVVTLKINKGSLDITQETFEETFYLNESATQGSKKSLKFSSFFELEKIEASTWIPDGNKFKELKVTSYKEKDDMSSSFYDDTKSLNFIYPDLRKGAKTHLKYTEKIKDPRFLTPFYFGDFFPVVNNKFTIIAHKDINFSFKEFNLEGVDMNFTETVKGGNRIYTWELKNVKEYKSEHNAPTYKKVIPHIIPVITSYTVNGSSINVLNDVNDLFQWYNSLVSTINLEETDEELVQLVEELVAGRESDLEKVRSIYYWTQQNIKYIAFEYALGGFIPREANAVFQKKYGDCKDNSSILHKMLEIAGLKGNLTWIGTRSLPYTYEQVPTPLVDNHMILAYQAGEDIFYLDATGRYLPLEYPSSFIQGKEALIAQEDGRFIIKEVPVVPSTKNSIVDIAQIQLDGEDIIGKAASTIKGYPKIDFFNSLEELTTENKIREFYNVQFSKGSNRFLIEDLEEVNKFDYEKDLVVNYSFNIKNHAKIVGDELFVNLNLNKDISFFKTKEDRKNEVEHDYKKIHSYIIELEVPNGYEIEYLPENLEVKNDFVSASISYSLSGNIISYNHTINLDFLTLDLAAQKEVNSLIRKVEKAYKEIIVFKKS